MPLPGDEYKQLAIIVSRSQLGQLLPDIGLLVQVDEIVSSLAEGDARRTSITYCKIISRLRLRRLTERPALRLGDRSVCYAEALSINQRWVVEGFDESYGVDRQKRIWLALVTFRPLILSSLAS